MPTYDYECKRCGNTTETFHSIHDTPKLRCSQCGKQNMQRLISGGVGVVFKGGGFYVTDSNPSSATTKDTDTNASETKDTPSKETAKNDTAASSASTSTADQSSTKSAETKQPATTKE